MTDELHIGMVAGEPSGDLLGSSLIQKLQQIYPFSVKYTGLGGLHMQKNGFESIAAMERLSVMGLIEPLFHLRDLFKLRHELLRHFLKNPPQVFIGIDSPDFNLGLELKLRHARIPVVHYVSPSVWAWRQKRVFKIAKAVDLMLTLFPFETKFYQKHGIPVAYIGHPLADSIPLQPDKIAARQKLNLDLDATYVALLPGSRQHEIKHMAPLFLAAAEKMIAKKPSIKFITTSANSSRDQEFKIIYQQLKTKLPLQFFQHVSHEVMAAVDAVMVTSGTATLETMLFKQPMVIAYRTHFLTYQIAKRLVKVPFIGLPNLLAEKKCVPEFIQDKATPDALSSAILEYLEYPEKVELLKKEFLVLHQLLRQDANNKAANMLLPFLKV